MLNQPYEAVHFQGIGTAKREGELAIARRYGDQYSENNMGFGEGRVLYMVDLFENAPEQSLFVLEEPETSLHRDAQHRLARYLIDVVNRRHHQVLLSTHSSTILGALPAAARKLLHRDASGVSTFEDVSTIEARSMLSGGHERLDVIVEDAFAKLLLTEIVRVEEANLLPMLEIHGVGSDHAVRESMRLLTKLQKNGVGFVDGDAGPDPGNGIACLPGGEPPERLVFGASDVQDQLAALYGVDVSHLTVGDPDVDHHDYSDRLARACSLPVTALEVLACTIYAENVASPEIRKEIVEFIRERVKD